MRPEIKGLQHDHIDGSRALVGVIEDLYRLAGERFPFPDHRAWADFFADPHEDIVARFDSATRVMQSAEALEMTGSAYGAFRAAEGYRYVEAKFAPQYHVRGGLTMRQAADAMIAGLRAAERGHGIRILPVLCIGRETDPDTGVAVARIALEYDGEAAIDLACDEAENPPEKHLPAFRITRGTKVKRDCHAGEWVRGRPRRDYRERLLANVRTAVRVLEADGVGHAIPLADDPGLMAEMAERGVRVAGCPLSNLSLGGIGDVRELRIDEILAAGVLYTLNADDDLFLPPMADVIDACDAAYRFDAVQRDALERNVFRGAFAPDVRSWT